MREIEIKTERLLLKPLGIRYLETVSEYALDPENTKYMMHLPNADREETAAFLRAADAEWAKESPAFYEFAVLCEGVQIGAVSVYYEDGAGELGWILNRRYWGRGFTTEAARALIEWCAKKRGTARFIAHCDAENAASRRVMEKLGMVKTGEWGGRRNRSAARDSMECQYELTLTE